MGVKNCALKVLIENLAIPFMERFLGFEKAVLKWPQAFRPDSDSPERFNIPIEAMKNVQRGERMMRRGFSPRTMMSIMRNMRNSVRSLIKNPDNPQTVAPPAFFSELGKFAHSIGISHVGYAKLQRKHVFKEMAVLHSNAIVLAMEMDKDRMDKAPSNDTMVMVMETYDELGIAANKIAEYLRKMGYSAHAGHPLGGMALYPPLGQISGIGFHGRHGLIITPEFGPRIRLTAVFTSIENLPYQENNEHAWVRDFCDSCLLCIKMCPTKAILGTPIIHESGKISYVDRSKCFPFFLEHYGCSVCIRVCPFSTGSYAKNKETFKV